MAKFIVSLILLISQVAGAVSSAQGMDACGDRHSCSAELSGPEDCQDDGADCPCQTHHRSCCHPVPLIRSVSAIEAPTDLAVIFFSEISSVIPSPILEGPFQPPRA